MIQVTNKLPQSAIVVPVCIEKDDTGYFGYSPAIQGLFVGGMTKDEVWENLQIAVRLNIASYVKHGEELPPGCIRGCGIPISDALSRVKKPEQLPGTGLESSECEELDLIVSV